MGAKQRALARLRPVAGMLSLAVGALGSGCAADELVAPPPRKPQAPTVASPTAPASLQGPPGLSAARISDASGAAQSVGYASRGGETMVVVIERNRLISRRFSPQMTRVAELDLGSASGLAQAPIVKAREGGWLVLLDRRVDSNHFVELRKLDANGRPEGDALVLPPIADERVSFVDVALLSDGALVLAEVREESSVRVVAVPIDPGLGRAGTARTIVSGAFSWGASQARDGVFVATVAPPDGSEGAAPQPSDVAPRRLGAVRAFRIDAKGTASAPLVVEPSATAEIDLEIAALSSGALLAWTDAGSGEGAVKLATIDDKASAAQPARLVEPPIGDQALVRLVASPTGTSDRALLAWENLGERTGGSRVVRLATVDARGALDASRARLLLDADDRPDFAQDEAEFLALTLAPATTSEATDDAPRWPTVVRFDRSLEVRSTEPVRFLGARSADGVPDATFELGCNGGSCFVLAADDLEPPSLHLVSLAARPSPWRAPAWRVGAERRPGVAALSTVAEVGPVASVATGRLAGAGATIASWVTYFVDGTTPVEAAPKGEPPYSATLGIRVVGDDGSSSEPIVLSRRALSLGGVAIALPQSAKKPEAVVAWVADDRGQPQVFATKVDARGKKVVQRRVTIASREAKSGDKKAPKPIASGAADTSYASSVAIAWSAAEPPKQGNELAAVEGYVLAWIDTRDGNAELYAARLNKDLDKIVADRRLTTDPGETAEVSLVLRGSDAWIAFTDRRDERASDVYLTRLDARTLRVIEPAYRVYASVGASRAPRLVSAGDRLLLAWLEEADQAGGPTTMRIGELDESGKLRAAPAVVAAPERGSITGLALACPDPSSSTCRSAIAWSDAAGQSHVGAFTFDTQNGPGPIVRLGAIAVAPLADPLLGFSDPEAQRLFFAEELAGAGGRLRAVGLAW